jgi:hypothetical protein
MPILALAAEVDSATEVGNMAEAVKNLTVSQPPPAPSRSEASPNKGGGGDHDEDDDQEEDQEARNKELQRIHEELQKADNRCKGRCLLTCSSSFPAQ